MDFEAIFQSAMTVAKAKALTVKNDYYCGFAWVSIDGNTAFARHVKKKGERVVHKGYPKGLEFSVYPMLEGSPHAGTQSMYVKEEVCSAFAEVLRAHGIKAHMHSRAD